jgi:hypothetical protein
VDPLALAGGRLVRHRDGFGHGVTQIARVGDDDGVGIELAVVKLVPGERIETVTERETAWLLLE